MIEDKKMMPCSGLLWCHLNACLTSLENCEAVFKNWEIDPWTVKNRKVILINQFQIKVIKKNFKSFSQTVATFVVLGENNRKKIHANDNRGGGKWKWMVPDPWGVLPKETVSCQLLEMLTTES